MSCKYYTNITIIDPYPVEIDITDKYYISLTIQDSYYVEIRTCEDILSGIGYWIIEDNFIIQ